MRHNNPRELRDANGQPTGLWHYTVYVDSLKLTYPIGYCADNCPGHATPDEAREHYRQYLLDEQLTYGDQQDVQYRCSACQEWTTGYAHIPDLVRYWPLCSAHQTREEVEKLFPAVGDSIGSV